MNMALASRPLPAYVQSCCSLFQTSVYACVSGVKFLCTCSFGIRCNAVLPGFISTPMTDKVPDKIKKQVRGITVHRAHLSLALCRA